MLSYAQSVLTVPTRTGCGSWNGIAIGCGGDVPRCRRKLGLCSGSGNAQLSVKNLAGYGPAACAFRQNLVDASLMQQQNSRPGTPRTIVNSLRRRSARPVK